MICDTTVTSKELQREINKLVGEPYGFFENLKIGGVGSPRLKVIESSERFDEFLKKNNDMELAYIEIRKGGIIVHVNKRATRLSWMIPFYRLSIFSTDSLSIHAEGHFIRFDLASNTKAIWKFTQKLMIAREIAQPSDSGGPNTH